LHPVGHWEADRDLVGLWKADRSHVGTSANDRGDVAADAVLSLPIADLSAAGRPIGPIGFGPTGLSAIQHPIILFHAL
jgi:hypothetical protein